MITLPDQAARAAVPANHPFNLPDEALLSQSDASIFIKVHGGRAEPSSLANWSSKGKGPPIVREEGRRGRYRCADLRRWLAGQIGVDLSVQPEGTAASLPASEAYVEKLLERIEALEVYAHELREECRRRRLENAGLKDRIAALMGEARAEGPALQD